MTPLPISRVAVVVPAHNEEQHLARALSGLLAAADVLQREHAQVDVTVMVVLDGCTDRSADIAAAYPSTDSRFNALEVRLRSTGASRAVGIAAAMDSLGSAASMNTTWLANTDADSTVPAHWLTRQVELANAGADAVLGTVQPNPKDLDSAVLRRWLEHHPFREDHPHIYGANFGVRASAYLTAGGFPKLRVHEDKIMVERLRRHGFSVTATDTIRVLTSGRTHTRAPQGFGAYLRALGRDMPPAVAANSTSNTH